MCGIVGFIGHEDALPVLMDGLKRMEYRGYDSAGVALLSEGGTTIIKRSGKIANLVRAVDAMRPAGNVGIGHTRWATHGQPNQVNAHPHKADGISIVHNGIIENYTELKVMLATEHKRVFVSDTDTEVLAHLIAVKRTTHKSLESAVLAALLEVSGTFGLVVLDESEPHKIVAARRGSPLLLGVTDDSVILASDAAAVIGHTDRVVYLDDDELVICTPGKYTIIDFEEKVKQREEQQLKLEIRAIEKGGYDHFLLKEIMEQPTSIQNILRGRLDLEAGTSHLGGLNIASDFYRGQSRFLTVACGTARFAGLLGQYILERMTGLPVDVEYGSEFRYREPVTEKGTLGIVITQSGETADTLASLREMKRRGIPTLGLVNVIGSSIAREVDGGVYLHAGPEISVASTKAFTSQVIAQILVGLQVGRTGHLSATEGREIIRALEALPNQVAGLLAQRDQIKQLAEKFVDARNMMYLGRDLLYPVALEASLKMMEISYIHTEAYPAGEMKHGPVSLIDDELPIVFFHLKNALYEKSRSNLEEVRARGGRLILVGTEGDKSLQQFSDDVLYIPDASPYTQPILANIPMQLFAYYMAVARGNDVDQPRNLAKSVSFE